MNLNPRFDWKPSCLTNSVDVITANREEERRYRTGTVDNRFVRQPPHPLPRQALRMREARPRAQSAVGARWGHATWARTRGGDAGMVAGGVSR
jgi:hypothetical protein